MRHIFSLDKWSVCTQEDCVFCCFCVEIFLRVRSSWLIVFKSTVFFLNVVLVPALTGREIEVTDYTVDLSVSS